MKCVALICVICYCAIIACAQEITGVVKTIDGRPVEFPFILPGFIEGDKSGKFKISIPQEKFIVVFADNFLPMVKKLGAEREIEIILHHENSAEKLIIPKCRGTGKGKYVGVELSLLVPKGMKSRRRNEIYYILDGKPRKIVLHGIWGFMAGRGYPEPDWINSTENINVRAVSDGTEDVGFDYYGTTTDGNHWRHIRFRMEDVSYIVDSEVKRTIFDRVFDNACSNQIIN